MRNGRDRSGEGAGGGYRIPAHPGGALHPGGQVGPECDRRSEDLLGPGRGPKATAWTFEPGRDFLEQQSLLQRRFIVAGEHPLHALGIERLTSGRDAQSGLRLRHGLDEDGDLHVAPLRRSP